MNIFEFEELIDEISEANALYNNTFANLEMLLDVLSNSLDEETYDKCLEFLKSKMLEEL